MEKISIFINGICLGAVVTAAFFNLALYRVRRNRRGLANAGGAREQIEQITAALKRNGIPFEIVDQLGGDNCPCPTCTARREQNKAVPRNERQDLH